MKTWQIFFLLFLVAGSIYVITRNTPYKRAEGKIFGTYYNIIYQSENDLHNDIKAAMQRVDASLSTFNQASTITAINNNKAVKADEAFLKVFALAQEISRKTDGAFDITVAPLVNAWGFGFKKGIPCEDATIDSLLRYVGYTTVSAKNDTIVKTHTETQLDCSAIAKGFGCDEVARTLSRHGIKNYMVEIGGEIVAKGQNDKGKSWAIGINKPIDDPTGQEKSLQQIVHISNKAMATSGNYRNYRYVDGKKISHTINPHTGRPVNHTLLSATVIADDCATADALATAFMVMGTEKALAYCDSTHTPALFIHSAADGRILTTESASFEQYK